MSFIPDIESRKWKFFLAIAAIVIALFSIDRFDPFGWKKANLVAVPLAMPVPPEQEFDPQDEVYVPWGDDKFTRVQYHNDGERNALIQAVSFQIENAKPQPARPAMAGEGEITVIPVNFGAKHYNQETKQFFMHLPNAIRVPGDEYAEFRVAIQIRSWAGKTMVGTLKVHFNGQMPEDVPRVELDPH